MGPVKVAAIFLGWPGALPVEITLRNSLWRFKVRQALDIWIIKETCLDRDYLWGGSLGRQWTIVDIGAGLGDFTVLGAKESSQGVVHAYEPLTGSFRLLEYNLELNGIENAEIFHSGVAASSDGLDCIVDDAAKAVSTRFTP